MTTKIKNIQYTAPLININHKKSPQHKYNHTIIILDVDNPNWEEVSDSILLKNIAHNKTKNNKFVNFYATNNDSQEILVLFAKDIKNKNIIAQQVRDNIKRFLMRHPDNIKINNNIAKSSINKIYGEVVLSIICCFYQNLPCFKSNQQNKPKVNTELSIQYDSCCNIDPDFSRVIIAAKANGLARYLALLPHSKLNPASYNNFIKTIAKEYNLEYEFYDIKKLNKLKAGAFLAVARGEGNTHSGIVHLKYKASSSSNKATKSISLVGKGICFDTGGHNLKTHPGSMFDMHEDMTGSAIALATTIALAELKVDCNIDCWLAIAQNDIGEACYRPSDVVTAANGLTIEVVNTDAEGRMVLADTLYLASKQKPDLLIDYATLTGSCFRALDNIYSGVICNKQDWFNTIINIGDSSTDRVWPFPYDADYDNAIKSNLADIKQCYEGPADVIRAARFLGKFIEYDTPWIHMDLSAHKNNQGLGYITSETNGFGVYFSLSAILDYKLQDQ